MHPLDADTATIDERDAPLNATPRNRQRAGSLASAVLVCFACSAPLSAEAGPMIAMEFAGQPLQYTKQGVVDGCGVRLVGVTKPVPGVSNVRALDVSFNVMRPGIGLVKGALSTVPVKTVLASKPAQFTPVAIRDVWLKAAGHAATSPIDGKYTQSTTPKQALLYGATADSVLGLVDAIEQDAVVQVGVTVAAKDMEHIYFGKVELSAAERAQFASCFAEWSDAVLKARPVVVESPVSK